MTIGEGLSTSFRETALYLMIILMSGEMALFLSAFQGGRSLRVRLLRLLLFVLSFPLLYLPMVDMSFHVDFPGMPMDYPPVMGWLLSLPAWTLLLADGLLAALLAVQTWEELRYRRGHLTAGSIKETLDLLPVGIAYGRPDGAVLFRNLAMDGLSNALTGSGLTNLHVFQSAVGTENPAQVRLPDNAVWQVDSLRMDWEKTPVIQLTATDITAQAGITAQMAAKNKKLRDIHLRLELHSRQAARMVIAQEMLNARMAVHDELGHILLESRRCLTDPQAIDRELLLQALKNTNTYLLREYDQDDTARDALADALDMAESIGVEVTLAGPIPAQGTGRSVLAAAIQECAANAVKHADGDALSVHILKDEKILRFAMQSNGRPPEGPVRESGGLKSLRALTEGAGGSMFVDSAPVFRLTISLPVSAAPGGKF